MACLLLAGAAFSPAAQAYSATGNLPVQSEPAGSTWDTVVADATAQSTGAMSGGTPIYHSTKLKETTLEGDFAPPSVTAETSGITAALCWCATISGLTAISRPSNLPVRYFGSDAPTKRGHDFCNRLLAGIDVDSIFLKAQYRVHVPPSA